MVLGGLGLFLLSAVLTPVGKPVDQDISVGIVCLLLAPVFGAAMGSYASGKLWLRGRTIELVIDKDGLEGWSVPFFRETTWARLQHPRIESRALVLPFSWPLAPAWAVVPARAFTPEHFERLVAILEEQGFLLDGYHASVMGRALTFLLDHKPFGRSVPPDGHLERFPPFEERHGARFAGVVLIVVLAAYSVAYALTTAR